VGCPGDCNKVLPQISRFVFAVLGWGEGLKIDMFSSGQPRAWWLPAASAADDASSLEASDEAAAAIFLKPHDLFEYQPSHAGQILFTGLCFSLNC
jgi:hypothetical protein